MEYCIWCSKFIHIHISIDISVLQRTQTVFIFCMAYWMYYEIEIYCHNHNNNKKFVHEHSQPLLFSFAHWIVSILCAFCFISIATNNKPFQNCADAFEKLAFMHVIFIDTSNPGKFQFPFGNFNCICLCFEFQIISITHYSLNIYSHLRIQSFFSSHSCNLMASLLVCWSCCWRIFILSCESDSELRKHD